MSIDCEEARRLMLESVSRPTAITVSRIISDNVTIIAKPPSFLFRDAANTVIRDR